MLPLEQKISTPNLFWVWFHYNNKNNLSNSVVILTFYNYILTFYNYFIYIYILFWLFWDEGIYHLIPMNTYISKQELDYGLLTKRHKVTLWYFTSFRITSETKDSPLQASSLLSLKTRIYQLPPQDNNIKIKVKKKIVSKHKKKPTIDHAIRGRENKVK